MGPKNGPGSSQKGWNQGWTQPQLWAKAPQQRGAESANKSSQILHWKQPWEQEKIPENSKEFRNLTKKKRRKSKRPKKSHQKGAKKTPKTNRPSETSQPQNNGAKSCTQSALQSSSKSEKACEQLKRSCRNRQKVNNKRLKMCFWRGFKRKLGEKRLKRGKTTQGWKKSSLKTTLWAQKKTPESS